MITSCRVQQQKSNFELFACKLTRFRVLVIYINVDVIICYRSAIVKDKSEEILMVTTRPTDEYYVSSVVSYEYNAAKILFTDNNRRMNIHNNFESQNLQYI